MKKVKTTSKMIKKLGMIT